MSKRHQDAKPVRANRAMRKSAVRRDRHHAHQDLHTVYDPDDLVVTVARYDHGTHQVPKRSRPRHWKIKAWKRRTRERHERNVLLMRLTNAAG